MKLTLIRNGKLHLTFAQQGYNEYAKRLGFYCRYTDELLLVQTKSKEVEQIKKVESEAILKKLKPSDFVVLLDERGKQFSSAKFSQHLQEWLNHHSHIVFVIGGAYGFTQEVYQRANFLLSMSDFTYSHQLMPLLFSEQLYRAFTILKGEPYHHEG